MICKRCGHDLPLSGYQCTNCGTMMSLEQIKKQKENNVSSNPINQNLVSERYAHKDFIYKEREEERTKYKGLFVFLGILGLIILIGILVYL